MKIKVAAAVLLALGATGSLCLAAGPDRALLAAAQAARAGQLQLLADVVNIDSGTGDAVGGSKVADVLIQHLTPLGAGIEEVPAESPGLPPNTVATLSGSGHTRILMIGHLDTVFEPGTAAKRPFRTDEHHAFGPGVADEKGGVVEGILALTLLHDLGHRNYGKIVFLIESSEERGSPGTRALIARLLKEADVELNLEPGDAPDAITVWRKGSTTFTIDVQGRAAHAGVAPQEGRNAALELIHQIQAAGTLPTIGDGLTANVTVMQAGTRNNIIPEHASAQINVRVRERADFGRIEALLRRNAATTVVPDTHVTVSSETAYPPLPDNPATQELAARAQRIYGTLGRTLATAGNGGASESALAADAGVPALDGLGPVGGGFHSDKEYLDLDTLTARLYLLTRLLIELGPQRAARPAR